MKEELIKLLKENLRVEFSVSEEGESNEYYPYVAIYFGGEKITSQINYNMPLEY